MKPGLSAPKFRGNLILQARKPLAKHFMEARESSLVSALRPNGGVAVIELEQCGSGLAF